MTQPTIEQIREAVEAATKGRRVQFNPRFCKEAEGTPCVEWDTSHETSVIRPDGSRMRGYATHKHADDAALDDMAPDLAQMVLDLHERATAAEAERDALKAKLDEAVEPVWTGKNDKNGRKIVLGDLVQHHNESPNTKPEYWNPIYRVDWDAPCFRLVRVAGGLSGSGAAFALRHCASELEVITTQLQGGDA